MALFANSAGKSLEDVLGQQAGQATAQTQDQYAQARKRLVAQQAHSGRLMSGVADYPLTDLDTQEGQSLSGIQSGLGNALGGIPSEDWLNNQDFQRSYQLAQLVASKNKPSTLDDVFSGMGAAGQLAGTYAAFA